MRHALNGCRAGADNGDFLIGQTAQPAARCAACIIIIPTAGMKCVPLKIANALNGRQFGAVERPIGVNNKARRQFITHRRRHPPATRRFVPFGRRDFGLKQRFVSQLKSLGNLAAIGQRFRCICIFLLRHETGFFQEWKINIGFNIARSTGIAVPIPSAAEIAALFQDKDIVNALLLQPHGR